MGKNCDCLKYNFDSKLQYSVFLSFLYADFAYKLDLNECHNT